MAFGVVQVTENQIEGWELFTVSAPAMFVASTIKKDRVVNGVVVERTHKLCVDFKPNDRAAVVKMLRDLADDIEARHL